MKFSKPIYIIGHRNPDTDSICSAIGYANLKRALGENVVPARAGKINAETKFVLEKFGVAAPKLITDLHPRVRDVMLDSAIVVQPDDTLRELGKVMRRHEVKSVPVIDENTVLAGIVSVTDLAKRYFDELEMQDLSEAGVELTALVRVLDGTVVQGGSLNRKVTGKVRIAAGSTSTIQQVIEPGDVVLVGDRGSTLLECIAQNIACLVVTGAAQVGPEILAEAASRGIAVISAPHDTYTCARLINQCIPVSMIMQKKVITFKPSDLVNDTREIIADNHHRTFPVVENGKLVGLIARDQLIVTNREKIILVDHNERSQAVEGIEEAQIIEIIDHHRLGGLQTGEPIFIRHEPVGSTGTIVANMHWHRGVELPADIAGLLLAAIVSDTVLFKSPTATAYDRETAEKLAAIAGLDMQEFGLALLKAGSGIGDMQAGEIVHNDLKEFQIGEYRMAIAQISVMDTAEVLAVKADLLTAMDAMLLKENYDMALLMITDIIQEGTQLIYAGQPTALIAEAFGGRGQDSMVYLPGVMSRKKQVIPPMVEAARNF
ncbi:putative manganese-dependent inorganic diphosphatase|uniref:inorganic diphosphatase n=1 Tax=Dendrosporobacter quercicolus TaxID=146817 RepID=A0A1G9NW68_9FIRM|nr:putative manganese-dependent inorganic diphosphatase [Dendrosporobacter quercicolus]NSL47456.1 putative manganese-dependent inorganic diphosphatase [Dendrosporobacter quercicolus DSM 1736]SDL90277.1 manganese-dependent inorganic pyrophosphatase [Dendrosporobacter quercicolus]